jgi:galactonate dehydratase
MVIKELRMKIIGVELFPIPPRTQYLKLSTDEGISGWGEAVLEGRASTVGEAVREMADWLVGRDPERIEDIWQTLHRAGFYHGGPILMSALSGIDQALWDIKGKRYGLPVYQLLGGLVRERMQVYAWISGETPEEAASMARQRVTQGYKAIKMGEGATNTRFMEGYDAVEAAVKWVGAVRQAIGDEIGLGVDFHGHLHKGVAKVVAKELEPLHPLFIEEPVLPENNEALGEIARHCNIPIATGERMFSRWDFKRVLQEGYVDILQPDLSHAGGISEVRRIAAMAEAYDVALAPHCPLGAVAFAACLQVDFQAPNAFIQEQVLELHSPVDNPPLSMLVDPSVFRFQDGYVMPPEAPGLGIQVDEEAVRRAAEHGHRWRPPLLRARDGSVSDW